MLSLRNLLGFLAMMTVFASCRQATGVVRGDDVPSDDSLVVLFTGDVLLDRGVRKAMAPHAANWLLDRVAPYLRSADATVINLECPLTDVSTPLGKRYVFRGDTCMAAMLRRAGITHATLANNHTNDQGEQGLRSTLEVLSRSGIVPMGCDTITGDMSRHVYPTVISRGRLHVAVFCAVMLPLENWMPRSGDLTPCQPTIAQLANSIRRYRQLHPRHHVVCVLHWGVEFQTSPSLSQIRQSSILAQAGADAIIGHHPHVVQLPRKGDPIPIFYSLGGFVFDHRHPLACEGAMVRLVVRQDSLATSLLPVRIRSCRPELDLSDRSKVQ